MGLLLMWGLPSGVFAPVRGLAPVGAVAPVGMLLQSVILLVGVLHPTGVLAPVRPCSCCVPVGALLFLESSSCLGSGVWWGGVGLGGGGGGGGGGQVVSCCTRMILFLCSCWCFFHPVGPGSLGVLLMLGVGLLWGYLLLCRGFDHMGGLHLVGSCFCWGPYSCGNCS